MIHYHQGVRALLKKKCYDNTLGVMCRIKNISTITSVGVQVYR